MCPEPDSWTSSSDSTPSGKDGRSNPQNPQGSPSNGQKSMRNHLCTAYVCRLHSDFNPRKISNMSQDILARTLGISNIWPIQSSNTNLMCLQLRAACAKEAAAMSLRRRRSIFLRGFLAFLLDVQWVAEVFLKTLWATRNGSKCPWVKTKDTPFLMINSLVVVPRSLIAGDGARRLHVNCSS